MNSSAKSELIAERLKAARIKKGYRSCRDFSLKHNFNERTYQRHESAANNINFSDMIKYCQSLNISLLWLQTGDKKYLDIDFSPQNICETVP